MLFCSIFRTCLLLFQINLNAFEIGSEHIFLWLIHVEWLGEHTLYSAFAPPKDEVRKNGGKHAKKLHEPENHFWFFDLAIEQFISFDGDNIFEIGWIKQKVSLPIDDVIEIANDPIGTFTWAHQLTGRMQHNTHHWNMFQDVLILLVQLHVSAKILPEHWLYQSIVFRQLSGEIHVPVVNVLQLY